jgi:serine/threonine protein kinase
MQGVDLSENDLLFLRALPHIEFEGVVLPAVRGIPILRRLGTGGQGAVYLGWNLRIKKNVAIKVLKVDSPTRNEDAVRRFRQEAQLAANINSSNLVRVEDIHEEAGLICLIMEFVSGRTAQSLLKEPSGKKGLSELIALEIVIATTKGLLAAHNYKKGVVHRDIKPDNILIPYCVDGETLDFQQAKLADLGLARKLMSTDPITLVEMGFGTLGYAPQEQLIDARNCTFATDVFGVGASLHALLTGRAPFHGMNEFEIINATLKGEPTPIKELRSDVSELTAQAVQRCLSKDPSERFSDAAKLLIALEQCKKSLLAPKEVTVITNPKEPIAVNELARKLKSPVRAALLAALPCIGPALSYSYLEHSWHAVGNAFADSICTCIGAFFLFVAKMTPLDGERRGLNALAFGVFLGRLVWVFLAYRLAKKVNRGERLRWWSNL